jgi:hypothetical protein
MRPSLRFLGLAIVGWAGIRAATLGSLPGAELFSVERSEAKTAPIVPTQFPEIAPIAPASAVATIPPYQQVVYPQPIFVPVYYPRQTAPAPQAAKLTPILPIPAPQFYSPVPQLDEWPLSRIAASSRPARSQTTVPMQTTAPAILADRLDRVQLTMWALLRGQQGQLAAQPSLASGGTLGGSQAGMRLFYNFSPQIAAVLRSSSDVGRRGGEVALGVRAQPLRSLPVWITAERRQALGKYGGGRNAFAVFAETGVYGRPLPWGFSLDGYAQAGIVDFRSRDLFADGGFTVTRPLFSNFSGGFGIWGGIQPHLSRVDAGPRVTMRVRRNLRVHLDWRQRIAGNAAPGSGPALTLAGDF